MLAGEIRAVRTGDSRWKAAFLTVGSPGKICPSILDTHGHCLYVRVSPLSHI